MGGPHRTWRIALGSLAALIFAGASLALASGSLTTEKETADIGSSGEIAKTTPSCQGKKPVSGGFVVMPKSDADHYGFPVQLERGGQNSFHSRVGVVGDPGAKVVGYSYCQPESSQIESKSVNLPDDLSVKSATAKCDRGKEVVGGGFSLNTNQALSLLTLSSRPKGSAGWKTSAVGVEPDGRLESQVLCRAHTSTTTVSKTRRVGDNNDFARFSVSAKCPKGTRVLSGGFDLADEFSKGGPFLVGSRRVGERTWKLDVVTEVRGPVKAYAVCE